MSRIIFPDFLTISYSLFVFSVNGPKQNARSLLTPVSDPTFYALSHGSKHFLLHGSSNNRLFQRFWLAVEEFWPIRKWLKKLPWRAKLRLPCERAWKAGSETGVKSDLAFCLGSLFKKTNSDHISVSLHNVNPRGLFEDDQNFDYLEAILATIWGKEMKVSPK